MKKKTEYKMNNATLLLIMAMAQDLRGYANAATDAGESVRDTDELLVVANEACLQHMGWEENE